MISESQMQYASFVTRHGRSRLLASYHASNLARKFRKPRGLSGVLDLKGQFPPDCFLGFGQAVPRWEEVMRLRRILGPAVQRAQLNSRATQNIKPGCATLGFTPSIIKSHRGEMNVKKTSLILLLPICA